MVDSGRDVANNPMHGHTVQHAWMAELLRWTAGALQSAVATGVTDGVARHGGAA
jgi:hypothetical protein